MSPNSSIDSSAARAAGVYAQANIENAPPTKIVRLLYQGALRFLDSAAGCDPSQPNSKFDHWIGRAEDIVVELRLGLQRQHAPEIADNLSELYLFVEASISRARRERTAEHLIGARQVLARLLEAWTALDIGKI